VTLFDHCQAGGDHTGREMLVPDEHLSQPIAVPHERPYDGT
jgi:hypothetical protein